MKWNIEKIKKDTRHPQATKSFPLTAIATIWCWQKLSSAQTYSGQSDDTNLQLIIQANKYETWKKAADEKKWKEAFDPWLPPPCGVPDSAEPFENVSFPPFPISTKSALAGGREAPCPLLRPLLPAGEKAEWT